MSDFNENLPAEELEDDLGTVVLTMDDDTELECAIVCIYPVADKQYIALMPIAENGEEIDSDEILIYRYVESADGEPDIENIEDDDEYDAAADAFDEILDDEEFEED